MTASGFWRIFWKEYRTLRGFWIAMGIFGLLLQAYAYFMTEEAKLVPTYLFGVSIGLPVFYMLGCAAVSFSAEREQETHDTLRAMPTRWGDILSGKVAFAIVSTIAVIAALCAVAGMATGWTLPERGDRIELAGTWIVGAVEALAWGLLFSLTLASPMRAAVLGAAAAVFSAQAWASTVASSASWLAEAESYSHVVPQRLATAAVVLIADFVLARFWMGAWGDARKHALRAGEEFRIDLRRQPVTAVEPRRGRVVRLVWQDLKQNRTLFLIFLGVTILAALWFGAHEMTPFVVVVGCLLVGSSAFLSDQTNSSYRFFANHGVSPWTVWFSRQLAMLLRALVLIAGSALAFAAILYLFPNPRLFSPTPPSEWIWQAVAVVTLALLAPMAIGQLASLLLRSQIVAFVVTVAAGGVFTFWCTTINRLGVSLWWGALPVLAIFFIVSWLRTPDWMLERKGWRPWAKIGGAFFAPLLALVVAVMFYRVYQIPKVEPGFSPEEFAAEVNTRSREKAALYEQAARSVTQDPALRPRPYGERPGAAEQTAWVRENQPAIDKALAAMAIPGKPFHDPTRVGLNLPSYNPAELERLFLLSATELANSGDHEASLERSFELIQLSRDLGIDLASSRPNFSFGEFQAYSQIIVRATLQSVTTADIRRIIDRLQELEDSTPLFSEEIKAAYLTAQRLLKLWKENPAEFLSEAGVVSRRQVNWLVGIGYLPTEHWRAERLMNALTRTSLAYSQNVEQAAQAGRPAFPHMGLYAEQTSTFRDPSPLFLAAYNSPLKGPNLKSLPLNPGIIEKTSNGMYDWIARKTRNRETRLILALIAWKKDHNGELPDDLAKLEGKYIDKVPLSHFTGTPFQLQNRMADNPNTPVDESKLPPFVWDPRRGDFVGWHYSGTNAVP